MRNNRSGFTLVELIVVIIIVGILAAIAAPMMTANINRARRSEAVAALGAIRTAERMYKTEYGNYAAVPQGGWTTGGALNQYIQPGDLNGAYYHESDYYVKVGTLGPGTFIAVAASGSYGTVSIDSAGNLTGY